MKYWFEAQPESSDFEIIFLFDTGVHHAYTSPVVLRETRVIVHK
jgi:hypothetical protein